MGRYLITSPDNKGCGNNSLNKENPKSGLICPEKSMLRSDKRFLVSPISLLIGPKMQRRVLGSV